MVVVLLATLASLAVSVSLVCVRRATVTSDPRAGAAIVVVIGSLIFPGVALASGDISNIGGLTAFSYALFAISGIVHFVVGRSFNYIAVQALGASRTTVIVTTYPIFALPLAIPLFDEGFTIFTAMGTLLVIAGPILMSRGSQQTPLRPVAGASHEERSQLLKGVLAAITAAALLGLSFVLVKGALNESDEPVLGTMISYWAAFASVTVYILISRSRDPLAGLTKSALVWYLAAGLFVALSQVSRYLALSEGDVTVVVVLMQTVPLFVFVLTFLMNRTIEAVNGFVIIGSILVVAGTSLVVSQG